MVYGILSRMKLRVYLDTSVFSAYYDDRLIERKAETEQFWKKLNQFEVSTSEIAKEELAETPDDDLRKKIIGAVKTSCDDSCYQRNEEFGSRLFRRRYFYSYHAG